MAKRQLEGEFVFDVGVAYAWATRQRFYWGRKTRASRGSQRMQFTSEWRWELSVLLKKEH